MYPIAGVQDARRAAGRPPVGERSSYPSNFDELGPRGSPDATESPGRRTEHRPARPMVGSESRQLRYLIRSFSFFRAVARIFFVCGFAFTVIILPGLNGSGR